MNNKNVRVVLSISLNMIIIIVGTLLIYTAGSRAYTFGHNIFDEQALDTVDNARVTEVTIPDNVSVQELTDIIYQRGLINDKPIFYFQVLLSDYKGKFVGGTYTLNTAMTPTEMMQTLCEKKSEDK